MNTFAKYFPTILQIMFTVQALAPTVKGSTKTQLVTNLSAAALGITGGFPQEDVQRIASGIAQSVTALQAAGVFVKDQVPATQGIHDVPSGTGSLVFPIGQIGGSGIAPATL